MIESVLAEQVVAYRVTQNVITSQVAGMVVGVNASLVLGKGKRDHSVVIPLLPAGPLGGWWPILVLLRAGHLWAGNQPTMSRLCSKTLLSVAFLFAAVSECSWQRCCPCLATPHDCYPMHVTPGPVTNHDCRIQ
jgi:hypothetical protein